MGVLIRYLQLGFLLFAGASQAGGVMDYPHKRLNQAIQSGEYDKGLLVFFFEPHCSWCLKQAKTLNGFYRSCPRSRAVVGLGVNGSFQALKKAAFRLQGDFPLFMADIGLKKRLGKISATPFMLLFDDQDKLLRHATGFLDEQALNNFLKGCL